MVHLGETITVINKSGKVVSTSKHLVNVFKEAKSAYRERKAEIQAERNAALEQKKLQQSMRVLRIEDDVRSRASSRRSHGTHRSHRHRKPPIERGYTDSFYANDENAPRRQYEEDVAGEGRQSHNRELARRHTEAEVQPVRVRRADSESDIDMDLAYGDLPPPLPAKKYDDDELKEKASKLTRLLDEANCLHHSATATIDSLQKNPDALAAVALTLAEISSIVGKMGPGALVALKGSFPAIVALLASPHFLIAAGVGVGVTIVALGGYKIIKKIQEQQEQKKEEIAMEAQQEPYELDELQGEELSRIEMWRRGIADAQAESSGSTVDGEFITPGATRQLVAAGVIDEDDLRSRRSSRTKRSSKDKEHRSKSHKAKSVKSESTSKSSRSKSANENSKKKKKEPSGLRMLFRTHTTS
ncbi:hypothetical protein GQ43DRAFT_162819 [Delitschia confertaspora ATCC 74209]|uniref:Uncharacterized protein n=1 Tax=Delitschia confertaspora ATCC 74209 TaxID=1513339 RepID=A0A9P4MPZ3_9PLEO|nr:hypothetical protein GQ43DRAFT_162819 [Delitschia confertaspora ATCC 74209]